MYRHFVHTSGLHNASRRYRFQQFGDFRLHLLQIRVDGFQRPGGLVLVEVAIEVDLVADDAHLAVLLVLLAPVNPGIRHMGRHFPLEVVPAYKCQVIEIQLKNRKKTMRNPVQDGTIMILKH